MPDKQIPTYDEIVDELGLDAMSFFHDMVSPNHPKDRGEDEASVTVPMKPVNLPNVPAGYGPAPFEPGGTTPQIAPIAAPGRHYGPVYGPGELT